MWNARLLSALCLAALAQAGPGLPHGITTDADSDCYYVPAVLRGDTNRVPALVILHCVGARPVDLDTCRLVGDSLGWILATCHRTRNHRDGRLNDADIVKTVGKLLQRYPVDPDRIFLFGFSGQGVQALATMALHPSLVRGTVTVCAHDQGLAQGQAAGTPRNLAYLVTREQDWNREANQRMHTGFNLAGLRSKLVTTPGEHGPGSWLEILAGCRWLNVMARP
jgi:pimeloyl-ACP methyl ester carboxylesterase